MKSINLYPTILLLCCIFQLNGQTQNGILLDGVDDYIDCGPDASLDITGHITIEAWIYLNGTFEGYVRIIERDWATSYFFGSSSGTNGLAFGMDPNNDVANLVESNNDILYLNRWIHVAGTWNGSTLNIFKDGILVGTKPWINNSVDGSTNAPKIGVSFSQGAHFNGYMDEIRIWNVARSVEELRENMYKELDNPGGESNLIAYYRFNEGTGQISEDLSSNTNTGVFGGTLAVESSDPSWIPSTCPLPYYTIIDGNWKSTGTWAAGQQAPTKNWARVTINNNVTINIDETVLDVTINPTGALTVNDGIDMSSFEVTDQFTIKSDASGTGSFIPNGYYIFYAENITVERYYGEDEWHLISSPLFYGLTGIYTGMYLQRYNEVTAAWSYIVPENDPLNIMQGYALWIPVGTTYTAEYKGTLTNGLQSKAFTADNPFGWNLMGNPYPSAVDWDMVGPVTGMNSAIYYLDAASGNYVARLGGIGVSQYIPPMQGFWISCTSAGSLSFDNDMRTHLGKDTYYKEKRRYLAVLKASGNDFEDKFYVYFNDSATASFDGDTDAYKLISGSNDLLPQIFSYSDDEILSIDARPSNASVSLGFLSNTSGIYTISLDEYSDFSSLILEDLFSKTFTELTQNHYEFTYCTSDNDNRFILHFGPKGIEDNSVSNTNVYSSGDKIYINLTDVNSATAFIYNMAGQVVYQQKLEQDLNTIPANNTGNYIVRVISDNSVIAKKVYVK